jgi:glycosyltransferase involved in cell wall biosynthesis
MTPDLSILIGMRDDQAPIEACLGSLEPQLDERVEVVLADGTSRSLGPAIRARFPWVHLRRCAPMNAGELRREAFLASRGQLVALVEPHIIFAPGWVAAALAAGTRPAAAVGGAVIPGPDRSIGARAAFLCEYADFLPPLEEGYARVTTGNNVVYPRAILAGADLADGLWKAWVNDELASRGRKLWTDPNLVVQHNRAHDFRTFLFLRFHHGRSYGARRSRAWTRPRRFLFALMTGAIPVLFGLRIVRAALVKPAYVSGLLGAQPLIWLFNAAWAVGEAWGYLAGAGNSPRYL